MTERPDNNPTQADDATQPTNPPLAQQQGPTQAPDAAEGDASPGGDPPANDAVDPMDQLRQLLVGPEQTSLHQIKQRLDDLQVYARDVSRVLPDAVGLSTDRDERLARALGPTIESSLTDSVRKNPRNIVNAIFPVMGPAIRKAIIDTLGKMIQSLNQALEFGLSPRALLWRIQAWRTGKSFAEVVMLHTLLFRVEQVFLIRGDDGILLQHNAADETDTQDGDMVSGMLTAITDFVQDSFNPTDGAALDSLQVGELNVWIERGPHAVLAVVLRGNAPATLREEMQTLVEQIHEEFSEELPDTNCDQGIFERVRPDLESLLQEGKKRKGKPILAWIVVAFIVGLIAWLSIASAMRRAKWQEFLDRLDSEPGIVITNVDSNDSRRTLRGLCDPLARPIKEVYAEVYGDGEPEHVVDSLMLKSFHATDSGIAQRRVQLLLAPPQKVTLSVDAGVLTIQGPASFDLIERTRRLGPTVAGIDRVQEENLVAADLESIVLTAARDVIKPPATVKLRYSDGTLIAEGEAEQQWISEARVLAKSIERVKRYDDRQLTATDLNDIVIANAMRILSPPAGVELSFDKGVLTATGKTTGKWIKDARVLSRTIEGVKQFKEENLTADDLTGLIMADATRLLAPPDTVKLELNGNALTARGQATTRWIADAKLLARTLSGVVSFNTSDLQNTDADNLVLAEAIRVLSPPANVSVTFKNGQLTLTGKATTSWIADARVLSRAIAGVNYINTAGLQSVDFESAVLADAATKLQLPASVKLSFTGGTLKATGSAKKAWFDRAAIVGPLVDNIKQFDASGVTVTDLAAISFGRVVNALRPPASVKLELRGRSVVATGKASHDWLTNAKRIAPGIEDIEGVDLTGVEDEDQTLLTAAVTRLRERGLFYGDNSANLPLDQARQLGQIIADARDIAKSSKALATTVQIEIIGHSDTEQERLAKTLSITRANEMLKEFIAQGVPADWLTATGKGNSEPYLAKPGAPKTASSRRVVFRVIVNQAPGR